MLLLYEVYEILAENNLNSNLNGFSFTTQDNKYGFIKGGVFHPFGNPYLRYDEGTGYVQALDEDGNWIDVYYAGQLPISSNACVITGYKTGTFKSSNGTVNVSHNGTNAYAVFTSLNTYDSGVSAFGFIVYNGGTHRFEPNSIGGPLSISPNTTFSYKWDATFTWGYIVLEFNHIPDDLETAINLCKPKLKELNFVADIWDS